MRAITEGNLLLSRLFRMPKSAASAQGQLPFMNPPTENFVAQATAAAAMPLQPPPGTVPLGGGAMSDCYVVPVPPPQTSETMQATIWRFEEAFSEIEAILNAHPEMPQREAILAAMSKV